MNNPEKVDRVFTHLRNLGLTGGVFVFSLYMFQAEAKTKVGDYLYIISGLALFVIFIILFLAHMKGVMDYLFPEDIDERVDFFNKLLRSMALVSYMLLSALAVNVISGTLANI